MKRKFKINILLIATIAFFVSSCTKDLEVDIPDYVQMVIVEGSIEPGQKPFVQLTYNAPYFGNNDYSDFSQFIVKNALVTVNDGITTDTLKELFPGQGLFYSGQNMTGVVGRTYFLTINVNGKTYTSNTTIYPSVTLDSTYFKLQNNDSLGYMWATLNEPQVLGNCYRWYAKRIGKDNQFYAPYNSAFDDKFINGKLFDFGYDRGTDPNSTAADDSNAERGYFKKGDVVVVKFCTTGQNEYLFLRSYYTNLLSNGNPFASPSNIQSNVQGENVLGLWCGYNPVYDTVICN